VIRPVVILSIAMAATLTALAAEPDRLTVRGEAWQNVLERESSFEFSEADASMLFALSQFGGKCQIHMVYDPADWAHIMFRFVRDGKELLAIKGHTISVFRTENNVLYFAHFSTSSQGCVVTAHDLGTGKKLWESTLKGIRRISHSGYTNEVTMGLGNLTGTETKGEGVISIRGHEGFGDYVEILDRETGKVLARKIYREAYAK
jgi:hypothetical protein